MICHITRWKDLECWIPGGVEEWEAIHPLAPVEDVLMPRTERVQLEDTLGDWQAITIHFDGSVVPRDRTTPFKGAMFAAYLVSPRLPAHSFQEPLVLAAQEGLEPILPVPNRQCAQFLGIQRAVCFQRQYFPLHIEYTLFRAL